LMVLFRVKLCKIVPHRHHWFSGRCLFIGSFHDSCSCLIQLYKVEVLQLQLDLFVVVHWFFFLQLFKLLDLLLRFADFGAIIDG
jgi:hypothetical protein